MSRGEGEFFTNFVGYTGAQARIIGKTDWHDVKDICMVYNGK
jgi:hypothetical protein